MRFLSLSCLVVSLLASAAWAGPLAADSSVDDVLNALDARGKDLTSLTADVKKTEVSDLGGPSPSRTGKLYYQKLPDDNARFRVVFEKKVTGKRVEDAKFEYLYADGKLTDRDYRAKLQTTRQVLRPGEKMQIFKLQGPFPLPLGQSKDEVHKSFDVEKIPPADGEPAGAVHLRLKPKKGTDLARKFSTIDVWVDPKLQMPVRIDALDASESSQTSTELTNVKVNEAVKDADFQMEQVDLSNGWNAKDERFAD